MVYKKDILKYLKSAGLDFEVRCFRMNRNGEFKRSKGIIFNENKIVITFYLKSARDAAAALPEYKIYTLSKVGKYKDAKEVYEEIIEILNGNTNGKESEGYEKNMEDFAANMRYNPTKAEALFSDILTKKEIPFKTQYIVGSYIADFLIYDRIIVEVDGGYHKTFEQREKDRLRTKFLQDIKGYLVLRCDNEEVENNNFKDPLLKKILS